jgi:hypothetical protein
LNVNLRTGKEAGTPTGRERFFAGVRANALDQSMMPKSGYRFSENIMLGAIT